MDELQIYGCRYCGAPGSGLINQNDGKVRCQACGTVYVRARESARVADEINRLQDDEHRKFISNARKNLYKELNNPYINSERIINQCDEIKRYLPNDFVANFYLAANSPDLGDFVNALNSIDKEVAEENYPFMDAIVNFTIKSLKSRLVLPLENLIDNTYFGVDDNKLTRFRDSLRIEAEKIDAGVYNPTLTRDIFVLYSSADMKEVVKLVEYLEECENLKCFVARRNLQVGRHATQDYRSTICTAMDHCKFLVYVSTPNSRNDSCEAFDQERVYQMDKDIENTPVGYKNYDYADIPLEFKKPRAEYFVKASPQVTSADVEISKVFFAGLNQCYTPADVARCFYNRHITFGHKSHIDTPAPEVKKDRSTYDLTEAIELYNKGNYRDAFTSFKAAAEEDKNPSAQCTLGYLYEIGRGVARNTQKAFEWYEKAAENGNAQAIHNLAVCYKLGIGTEPDEERANELFEEAENCRF